MSNEFKIEDLGYRNKDGEITKLEIKHLLVGDKKEKMLIPNMLLEKHDLEDGQQLSMDEAEPILRESIALGEVLHSILEDIQAKIEDPDFDPETDPQFIRVGKDGSYNATVH